ncbi:hypothetical protein NQT62_14100 [Limnobacter humi]|uniref:SH3 domain-containing protein n=1 Tax=Limnobacter humi TaxID=1778671 RepID=A0ABT1WJ71_9BURK|nr:hypothetical protein [Limnobacter humi]MCQ8897570.1 hypothetical protein [Limnobacter humi]
MKNALQTRACRLGCMSTLLVTGLVFPAHGGYAQQLITNPLVRPASAMPGAPSADAPSGGPGASAGRAPSAALPGAGGDEALREKAAGRITQEDFNIRQQELNASNVPVPLLNMFSEMTVSAHVSGAVVLRRSEYAIPALGPITPATTAGQGISSAQGSQGPGQNSGGRSSSQAQAVSPIVASSVLRLKVGQPTNLSGYTLRAKLDGPDVTVEWLSNQGRWVTVFFGAIESAPNTALVPTKDSLEKVDTEAFKYLKPAISSRITGNTVQGGFGGAGGGGFGGYGSGGFGGGFGGGGGGYPSPGFGTSPGLAAPLN